MASGFPGHEYDFYRFVKYSPWLGGDQEYALLNEAFPYWFNGIVPLAYALDDGRLKDQIRGAVSYITSHQASDGWLGPETGNRRNLWARFPVLLGFIGLLQADPAAYRNTILASIQKFISLMLTMLENNFDGYVYHPGSALNEFDHTWGRVRMADCMISLQWLLENEPSVEPKTLTRIMELLIKGSMDWAVWFQEGAFVKEDPNELPDGGKEAERKYLPYMHGVNLGQGLKSGAVVRRFTHNDSLLETTRRGVRWTFRYHGAASGTILADERIAGLKPYYGSELCTTVETLYSLAYLYSALGDTEFASHAELIAYNALPAIMTPDHWGHQYVSQPNQPFAKPLKVGLLLNTSTDEGQMEVHDLSNYDHAHSAVDPSQGNPFWNVGRHGLTFGLEPNYPCCTVNQGQGWPKFLANSWMKQGNDGLVHALLGPSRVKTSLKTSNISVECKTTYPFNLTLTYEIDCSGPFTLYFRIPDWASPGFLLELSGLGRPLAAGSKRSPQDRLQNVFAGRLESPGGLQPVPVPSAGRFTLKVEFTTRPRTESRVNDAVAVFYGSLLYSLYIESTAATRTPLQWHGQSSYNPSEIPVEARDWDMTPTSPWAVAIDPTTIRVDNAETGSLPNPVWAPGAPPISLTVNGCEIDWPLYGGKSGSAAEGRIPDVAPPKNLRKCVGPVRQWKLVPHGSAKLHMSDLPVIDLPKS